MKNKSNKELILLSSLILAYLVILTFKFSSESAQAQIACNDEPPRHPNPRGESWRPGTTLTPRQISVVIFDPPPGGEESKYQAEFQAINEGILLWNSYSTANCSNIIFKEAIPAGRPYVEGEFVPDDTIFVIRPSSPNGQMDPFYGNPNSPTQYLRAARIRLKHPVSSNMPGALRKDATHEIGHTFGLQNESFPAQQNRSIMGIAWEITECDTEAVKKVYCPATPTPTPTPTPIPYYPPPSSCNNSIENFSANACPIGFTADQGGGYCCQNSGGGGPFECESPPPIYPCNAPQPDVPLGCPYEIDYVPCQTSPVLIDIAGDGFDLTNLADGVNFDLNSDRTKERLAWTAADADDAWLALDRNGNGAIDNGRELFGNFTPQPDPPAGEERNGFLALARYDKSQHGGDADGAITRRDAVFQDLRLWRDANHNGISETSELKTLNASGLAKIELDYKKSNRVDAHGNEFRYRAKVKDARGLQIGRWAWDVFLVSR